LSYTKKFEIFVGISTSSSAIGLLDDPQERLLIHPFPSIGRISKV